MEAHMRATLQVGEIGALAPIFPSVAGRPRSASRHGVVEGFPPALQPITCIHFESHFQKRTFPPVSVVSALSLRRETRRARETLGKIAPNRGRHGRRGVSLFCLRERRRSSGRDRKSLRGLALRRKKPRRLAWAFFVHPRVAIACDITEKVERAGPSSNSFSG